MNRPRPSLLLLVLLGVPTILTAQRAIVRLHQPAPQQWTVEHLWWVDVENTTGDTLHEVWFRGEVVEAERGQVYRATSASFDLPPGSRTYRYRDITIREQWYAPGYEAFVIRTGQLPEGEYRFIVALEPNLGGDTIRIVIRPPTPPRLVAPRDQGTVLERFPLFTWTALVPPPVGATYGIRLVEVMRGQTSQAAIVENPDWFARRGLGPTTLRYPIAARALVPGKEYAWQVQGFDRSGLPVGENEGKSEVFSFLYQPEPGEFVVSNLDLAVPSAVGVGGSVQARARFNVTGSGDVQGRFLLDGAPWRDFGKHVATSPDSVLSPPLPADEVDIGRHQLKVEVTEPDGLVDSAGYEVVEGVAGLDSLLLVPGVALLESFSAPMEPDGPPGSNRYRLSGTATMRLLSLDNATVPACTIAGLKFVLDPLDPFRSVIDTGLVRRSVSEDAALFGYKDGFLEATSVEFEKNGAPVDFVTINVKLSLPRVNATLYRLDDVIVRGTGIVGKSFSTVQEFSGWGVTFSLRDAGGARAIALGYDRDTLWASLSGDVRISRDGAQDVLTQFTGFRVTHPGKISGDFVIADPFELIPGRPYVKIDRLGFLDSLGQCYLRFSGEVESLPSPLDSLVPRTGFRMLWDADGRSVGGIAALNEWSPNRRGERNDGSEFSIPGVDVRLDLTYLGLVLTVQDGDLKLNQSRIAAALDVYFPFRDNAGELLPVAERRVAIGELVGDRVEGGVSIDFNGRVDWELPVSIPVIRGKKLDLGEVLRLKLDRLAIEPSPFALVLNCSLGVNVAGVEGGAALEGLKIPLSGDVSLPAIRGGEFRILEVVRSSVGAVRWASKDTTFTLNQDQTTGAGEAREFRSGVGRVSCSSFLLMEEARLNIGPGGSLASGEFERFLVYKTEDTKKVSLTGADLSVAGMQLLADFDYSNPASNLRLAGTLNLPSGVGVTAVGKIGNRDGNPSAGLFVAARGLDIPVGPGVMLAGVGGGFFVLPESIDLETVRQHCGFSSRQMANKFQDKKPRADDPGSFALMLYGEVEVAGTDELVWGKALVTLTTRRFDLDAEVKVLKATDMADGLCYLSVGWNPAYAEGRIDVHVNVVSLITGEGQFEFYVYSKDAWGVMGGAELEVVEIVDASTEFFVGNPGFLLEVEFDYGIDIYVLSGEIEFDGMVWYKQTAPKSWGGYAGLHASADILGGLAGARFGLEGALIGEPHYLVYCVGSLSVEVCWVEVFSGSIWVSIGANGLDGGTGRNSRYDGLIKDAQVLADSMQNEKDRVREAMADAQESMYALSQDQRERAGSALVEAVGTRHVLYRVLYGVTESEMLDSPLIKVQFDTMFDREAARLAGMRDTLERKLRSTSAFVGRVDTTRQAVDRRFAGYEAILEEELPSVREIGALGSPFRAKTDSIVIISGRDTSFTIAPQIGFDIDYAQAGDAQDSIAGTQADNERHRQELLRITGVIDSKLRRLDSLLYYSSPRVRNDMSSLCSLYQEGFRQVLDYYWYLGAYTDDNQTDAARKMTFMNRRAGLPGLRSVSCSSAIRTVLSDRASETHWRVLRPEADARQELIALLDPLFRRRAIPRPRDDRDLDSIRELRSLWVDYGMELWYSVPKTGYQHVIDSAGARWDTIKAVYRSGTRSFSSSWTGYTRSLDRVYSRKARLYELLYDLHDQLDRMGDVPTPEPRRWAIAEGRRWEMVERPLDAGRIGPLIVPRKEQLARLLTIPRITSFSGTYRSDNTTPKDFGRLDLNWRATHEDGVIDYSFYLRKADAPKPGRRPYKTLGRSRSLWQPMILGVNEPGDYQVFLRARGAGGYAIARRGVVAVDYAGPETPPQRNGMNTADTTPPTKPTVTTDTIIPTTGQISAGWRSQDGQSGIADYRYTVGRYFWSERIGSYIYSPITDWTSAGGRTEVNIRGLNLSHNRTYVLKVMATNGVGLWSQEREVQIKVDTSAPSAPRISDCGQDRIPVPNTVLASWQAAEDRESGILHYVYCLGSSPLAGDIRGWDTIPPRARRVRASPLPVSQGDTVFFTIRAVNHARLHSQDTASCVIAFTDTTPPERPAISSATFTRADSTFSARWSGSDDQSGIAAYLYRIQREEIGPGPEFKRVRRVLVDWTDVGTQTRIQDKLAATPAYITVKAVNGVGLTAQREIRVAIE